MNLKPNILAVLQQEGADENEIANLVAYFTAKLSEAEGSVAAIENNIASLQKQLVEETARADRIRFGIAKFVTTDEVQVTRKGV